MPKLGNGVLDALGELVDLITLVSRGVAPSCRKTNLCSQSRLFDLSIPLVCPVQSSAAGAALFLLFSELGEGFLLVTQGFSLFVNGLRGPLELSNRGF